MSGHLKEAYDRFIYLGKITNPPEKGLFSGGLKNSVCWQCILVQKKLWDSQSVI